jgi:ABC-type cobalamin/Fe3+-siderophores transport system ATPase subunit
MFLVADRVSYTYNRRTSVEPVHAVREISVGIARGSLTGLIGPNGCGKTTLLKLLAGVLVPDSGTVSLDGRALTAMSRRHIARRIAVVPQETHPAFEYTALEMALMGRHPHLGPFQLEGPADLVIARESLEATGTLHLAERSYMALSGGEKQRVIIAAALAQQADMLLLDEPTASLDPGYQLDIADLLRTLNQARGLTMVLATHDLNLAASVCRDLVLLRAGTIIASGPTDTVLTALNLERLYDVRADVRYHDGAGHLTVVPLERRRG